MAALWKKLVIFLVILIAILQIIHMALLSRLESIRSERKKRARGVAEVFLNGERSMQFSEYTVTDIENDRKKMQDAVRDSSILDSFGEYQIINHLIRAQVLGPRNFVRQDISLVTQSSISQLQNLPLLVKRWNGLVSVAVFALTPDIPSAIEAILLLRRCYPLIRYNVSFHLVYPLRVPSPRVGSAIVVHTSPPTITDATSCENVEQMLETMDVSVLNYDHNGVPYPNNLLRNVARRNSLTEFVFVVDVDLVVSQNLRSEFLAFAKESQLFLDSHKNDKTVYVVPAFEVKLEMPDARIPTDKTALLEMLSMLEARPFYFELCWKCQKHTDYETWQRDPQAPHLAVMFEVLWRDPWEPFYISRNDVPLYDERFRQYGFNRISQVCRITVMG